MTRQPLNPDVQALAESIMRLSDIKRVPDVVKQFRLYQEGLAKIEKERDLYRQFLLKAVERRGFQCRIGWNLCPLGNGPEKHFSTAEVGALEKTGLMWERFRVDLWHHCVHLASDVLRYLEWLRSEFFAVGRMERNVETVFHFDSSLLGSRPPRPYRWDDPTSTMHHQLEAKVLDLIDAQLSPLATASTSQTVGDLIRAVPPSLRELSYVLSGLQVREASALTPCYCQDSIRPPWGGWPKEDVLPSTSGVPVFRRTEALVAFGYVFGHWHRESLSLAKVWAFIRPAVPPAVVILFPVVWWFASWWIARSMGVSPTTGVQRNAQCFLAWIFFLAPFTSLPALIDWGYKTWCKKYWPWRHQSSGGGDGLIYLYYACQDFINWWYFNRP